ncbi:MAG: hypothetical protein IPH35_03405 [Rhodoferax sp.]|nr:hypothetical protein [Rhodoferax sp.]
MTRFEGQNQRQIGLYTLLDKRGQLCFLIIHHENVAKRESKISESDPLSGRSVPAIRQENPKWHTSEKTDRFDCQTEARNVPKWGF